MFVSFVVREPRGPGVGRAGPARGLPGPARPTPGPRREGTNSLSSETREQARAATGANSQEADVCTTRRPARCVLRQAARGLFREQTTTVSYLERRESRAGGRFRPGTR